MLWGLAVQKLDTRQPLKASSTGSFDSLWIMA